VQGGQKNQNTNEKPTVEPFSQVAVTGGRDKERTFYEKNGNGKP
jgi:hypothetical protein